jgi:hypothetical protein
MTTTTTRRDILASLVDDARLSTDTAVAQWRQALEREFWLLSAEVRTLDPTQDRVRGLAVVRRMKAIHAELGE